jgi:protocatechuate 3,4-dioxygenase beta subunit
MQVLHGGKQKYATPHFGGGGLLSGDSGDFPPVEVTAVTHAASNRTETNTDIAVWDGVNAFEWNPRTLRLAAPTAAVFTATDMGFLAGSVLDPAGDPVSGVELRLDTGQNATTGADGQYRFPPLAPGTFGLNASLSGWAQQFWPGIIVTAGKVAHANLTLDAAPGSMGELRGSVLDGQGAPVAGALVSVAGGSVGPSDGAGVFSIPGAPGGWVNFTVSKAGYIEGRGAAFVPPNGASRRTNVTLLAAGPGETGGVSVRVEDESSAPLPGARVWLDGNIETFQLTPANGTCLFTAVPAGVHNVSASLAGYRGAVANVTVPSGNVANLTLVLALDLSGNGTVAGSVRTAAGAPVSGANVLVEELNLSATTDASGNYSLAPVPAGIYTVTASADGHRSQTVEGLVVAGGAATVQDFVLRNVRAFFNRTLGVSVTGDFAGPGRLDIRRAPAPAVLPPGGFDRIFEVRASGFTCMTGLRIVVTGQLFRDSLAGRDLSKLNVRIYTHPGGPWNPGDAWLAIDESGYDAEGGFFWANVSHFSVFGIGFSPKSTPPTGVTIIALPPWLSPIAVVAIVLLVGVPIGIIVIRVRQPPQGGGRQLAPPPPPQRGANL